MGYSALVSVLAVMMILLACPIAVHCERSMRQETHQKPSSAPSKQRQRGDVKQPPTASRSGRVSSLTSVWFSSLPELEKEKSPTIPHHGGQAHASEPVASPSGAYNSLELSHGTNGDETELDINHSPKDQASDGTKTTGDDDEDKSNRSGKENSDGLRGSNRPEKNLERNPRPGDESESRVDELSHHLPSLGSLFKDNEKTFRKGKGGYAVLPSSFFSQGKAGPNNVALGEHTHSACNDKFRGKRVSLVQTVFREGCQGKGGKGLPITTTAVAPPPTICNNFVRGKGSKKVKGKGRNKSKSLACQPQPAVLPTTPTTRPSTKPTASPTSSSPSLNPSDKPSLRPSHLPTVPPSRSPSRMPSDGPSNSPSIGPTYLPTIIQSTHPSVPPTPSPTQSPTSPPITVDAAPFRLVFEDVFDATPSDYKELEQLVLDFFDASLAEHFNDGTGVLYKEIQGELIRTAGNLVDVDVDFVFGGDSVETPTMEELNLLGKSTFESELFRQTLSSLSSSNPFSLATSVQFI